MNQDRKIIFHGKHFMEFYIMQTQKVQEKIDFVLKIVRTVERIPKTYFKYLTGTDGTYEIRINVREISIEYYAVLMKEIW